jgi:SWI/SNF-related matrix-associated actin-dependent regulator 1 of chromatin subfamily A
MLEYKIVGIEIEIKFVNRDRGEWFETLRFVKSIPGREFLPNRKIWVVPLSDDNIKLLLGFGFTTGNGQIISEPETTPEKIPEIKIPEEGLELLRPYQINNLKFFTHRNGRALCGDEMGLGKTVSALSYLKINPDKRPVLIIATASTKYQWLREYKKWNSPDEYISILSGKTPHELNPDTTYIINWDILYDWTAIHATDKDGKIKVQWTGPLMKNKFKIIIADEIQNVGNPKSKRTKAFIKLGRAVPELLALSGTPFTSGPWQFFTILNLLEPDRFRNRWKFYERYCDMKFNGFGQSFKGASNLPELHSAVKRIMIRHKKKDHLKELPDKIKTVVPLVVEDRKEYDNVFQRLIEKEMSEKDLEILKNSIFDLKKTQVISWIEEFLDSGEKLIVYAYRRGVVEFLHNTFPKKSVKLYGGVTGNYREEVIQKFIKDDNCKIFIANLISGGVGIDGLQNVCSNIATVELYYNATHHWQAEDRLHRMGQKNSVNCNYLVMDNSIESDLIELLDFKGQNFSQAVDGKKLDDFNLLGELIKKYRGVVR